jgi:hypothetical protein
MNNFWYKFLNLSGNIEKIDNIINDPKTLKYTWNYKFLIEILEIGIVLYPNLEYELNNAIYILTNRRKEFVQDAIKIVKNIFDKIKIIFEKYEINPKDSFITSINKFDKDFIVCKPKIELGMYIIVTSFEKTMFCKEFNDKFDDGISSATVQNFDIEIMCVDTITKIAIKDYLNQFITPNVINNVIVRDLVCIFKD